MAEEPTDDALKKVPITFDGFVVGEGFLSSDGRVAVIRLNESNVAQEVRERMRKRPGSIAINPRIN